MQQRSTRTLRLALGAWAALPLLAPAIASAQVTRIGPKGGAAKELLASPVNADLVLAATRTSSTSFLRRSSDGGATFADISQGLPGLGDGYSFDAAGVLFVRTDTSVWRSADAGTSWVEAPLPPPASGIIEAIAASPAAAGRAWAVEGNGVWRTDDAGQNWTRTAAALSNTTQRDIVVHPTRADEALVIGRDFRLHWTTDGGASWVAAAGPVALSSPAFGPPIAALTGASVSVGVNSGAPKGLWRSVDQGLTWTETLPEIQLRGLAVDSAAQEHLVALDGAFVSAHESVDGGATWSDLPGAPPTTAALESAAFTVGAQGRLLLGSSGHGVLARASAGGDFFLADMGPYPIGIEKVLVDPTDRDHLVARLGNVGRVLYETWDGGASWSLVSFDRAWLELYDFDIDAHGSLYVAGCVLNGVNGGIIDRGAGIAVRDGAGWSLLPLQVVVPSLCTVTNLVISEANPNLILAIIAPSSSAGTAALAVSEDAGATWALHSIPGSTVIDLHILEGTAAPRIALLAGFQSGFQIRWGAYWSDNLGGTFQHQPAVSNDSRARLAGSRRTARRLMMALDQASPMQRSDDGLSTASPATPSVSTNALALGSVDPDLVVRWDWDSSVSDTWANMWVSRDAGQTWTLAHFEADPGHRFANLTMRSDDSEVFLASSAGIDAIPLEPRVGSPECGPAVANSSGRDGRLRALGSLSVGANDLRLHASGLPANVLCMLIGSQSPGFVPGAGGSAGNLCLGGGIGRFSASIQSSFSLGELDFCPDAANLVSPGGLVAASAGDQWYFQAWYRDTVGGQATSNFTDAISIVWEN